MSALPKNAPKESLTIRIRPEDRGLIDLAAGATGKNRTEFIVEAARRAAEDALLDRTLFELDADEFEAVEAWFDAPPEPNELLRRTMQTPAPWEKSN
jgi:uncharacterized protein (DUF1778 family)